MDEQARKRKLEETQLSIRVLASSILTSFSVDDAISVMKTELAYLEDHKRNGQPSEDFERAVSNSSTIVATCEMCERTHFVSHGDYDDGELDELREKAKMEPNKYIEEGRYDMIDVGYFNGKQVVLGCPCDNLARFEAWIWSHRYIISSYFKTRAERIEMDARLAREVATDTSSVVDAELR